MKTLANLTLAASLALGLAATSWAGGSACSEGGKASSASTASGSHCTRGAEATMTSGSHCSGMGAHATAARECHVGANQVMYSFAVPTAECSTCVDAIQKAAIAQKGVSCAHVDLSTRTAYIIADKKVNERDLSHAIADAGYKNKLTAEGNKAQTAFAKAFAAGDKSVSCCSKNKDRA